MSSFLRSVAPALVFCFALVLIKSAFKKVGRPINFNVLWPTVGYWVICAFSVGTEYSQATIMIGVGALFVGVLAWVVGVIVAFSKRRNNVQQ